MDAQPPATDEGASPPPVETPAQAADDAEEEGVVAVPPLTPRRLREDRGFTEHSVAPWAIGGPLVIAFIAFCVVLSSLTGGQDQLILAVVGGGIATLLLSWGWVWITSLVADDVRLLTHGVHTRGEVDAWEGSRLSYHFHDMLGKRREATLTISGTRQNKAKARLPEGSRLEVVFDPRDPGHAMPANFMFGKFEPVPEPEPIVDTRPLRPGAPDVDLVRRDRAPLRWASYPFADTFGQMMRRQPRDVDVGWISLDEQGIVAHLPPKAGGEVTLRWDRPFSVVLSTWMLAEGRVRLFVSLREHGAAPGQPFVAFQTDLDASQVSREVPTKLESYLFVPPGDFQWLWAEVAERAAIHGADPRVRVAAVGARRGVDVSAVVRAGRGWGDAR